MIQVIERAVNILEELALDGEAPLESMVRLPADNGDGIVAALKRANHLLMRKLAVGGFSAGNFIR